MRILHSHVVRLILLASIVVGAVYADQSAEPARKPIRIDLGAAGVMRGTPVGDFVEVRTRYTTTRVLAEQIGKLLLDPSHGSLTIVLVNGDRLERVSLMHPLAIETTFGELQLDAATLRHSITSAPPVSVTVDLRDGTILTGAPLSISVTSTHAGAGAVDIEECMQIRVSRPDGKAMATRWDQADPQPVELSGTVTLRTAFGEIDFPASEIARLRVMLRKGEGGVGAELGNLALASRGAVARSVAGSRYLNDGGTSYLGGGRGYAYGRFPCSFLVKLPRSTMVSHIRFLLWDRDRRSYQYVLETSVDGVTWDEIADCSEGWWRSWQVHSFGVRPARYIRVRGLSCTVATDFHIVELEAYTHAPSGSVRPRWSSGVPDLEARFLMSSKRWR